AFSPDLRLDRPIRFVLLSRPTQAQGGTMLVHEEDRRGIGLPEGTRHYRAFVGPPHRYDLVAAMQFNLLTALGLREEHYLLDIGCGSLRAGRILIPYLLPGRYHGIEPERWLLQAGIDAEVGNDPLRLKRPVFSHDTSFV